MLNFRNTNVFFVILLLLVAGVDVSNSVPIFIYPALAIAYSMVVFYGCYFVDSNFFLPVACSAKITRKEIAISFDDGPSGSFTPEMLQVLKEHDVKAAFFCIGNKISGNEQLLKQMADSGHIIGNHSYSHHFWFDLFSSKKMLADLKLMDTETEKAIGLKPKLFRPPYGVINPNLKKAIIHGGYTTVGWSVRSMDTVTKDGATLLKRITQALSPGAVFLFHDTNKTTLDILPDFIRSVKENGYQVVTLDKLLNLKAYA